MNYELMKKAYKYHDGIWPYGELDGMVVCIRHNPVYFFGKYARVTSDSYLENDSWQWVGTKADFNAYSESLRTNEINWDEAPEGATAFLKDARRPWLKASNGSFYSYSHRYAQWVEFISRGEGKDQYERAVKKPQAEPTAWQPKVGEECEVLNNELYTAEWEVCTPVFIGLSKAVYNSESCNEQVGSLENLDFRPIKTERDQLIELIDSCNMSSGALADVILNAGYRKTEEGK